MGHNYQITTMIQTYQIQKNGSFFVKLGKIKSSFIILMDMQNVHQRHILNHLNLFSEEQIEMATKFSHLDFLTFLEI